MDEKLPSFNASVQVFNNTSIIISINKGNIISLIIDDETVASFLTALFNSIWLQSEATEA